MIVVAVIMMRGVATGVARLCDRCGGGAALAVDPARVAVVVVLLLPDRHPVLDLVDDVAACAKRFVAMACADTDPDRQLANAETAGAMYAQRLLDPELFAGLGHDPLSLLDGQGLEGFVLELAHA